MKKIKGFPSLRKVFLNLILFRLFIPLMVVELIAIIGVVYLGERNLVNHQNQVAQSVSKIVDYHLDHGERILDAVARVVETSGVDDLSVFMKSTWEAYGHFETLYYLDKDNKIQLMMPSDVRYIGFEMNNINKFNINKDKQSLIISRPFISLRTGDPTVYLVRYLSSGGCIVGELNLGLIQKEITSITNRSDEDFIFIMDQSGTLLAHPSSDLVKEQTNLSNLGIFHSFLAGKSNDFYLYDTELVVGSAAEVERTGWVVVNQVPLSVFGSSYAWGVGITFLASMLIWLTLNWSLRKRLQRNVITPLEQLSRGTNALTVGDFSKVNFLSSIPTAFSELNKLSADFQFMSNNLQTRETTLRESEDRYRGLFNRVPIGLFRATLTGKILDINPMVMLILGYRDREELLKCNIYNLYSALINNGQEQVKIENMWNLINVETQMPRRDGTIIWAQISSHIVHDNKEQEQYLEGSIQDITQRKQTENMINMQQDLLLKAEITQREALEKALTMKDEFISLISHELKTPLNVIYSAVQLIECVYINQIPERVKGLVGNIKQNTLRQLRLANNLLDVTRLNSGHCKLKMKNIDIVFLTKAITQSVELYSSQKQIKLSFKSNVESKTISIDDEKYERIILNLLSNAIKFTKSGGAIAVTLNQNKKSDFLLIKVTDTGIGIPKDKQELIFERFGQVESNLSRQAEGTGIGLSLVKLLVNILGGTIGLESELGMGSTFSIMLPNKEEEAKDSEFESCLDIDERLVSEIKVEFSDIYF